MATGQTGPDIHRFARPLETRRRTDAFRRPISGRALAVTHNPARRASAARRSDDRAAAQGRVGEENAALPMRRMGLKMVKPSRGALGSPLAPPELRANNVSPKIVTSVIVPLP
jgi:hypothetical protein